MTKAQKQEVKRVLDRTFDKVVFHKDGTISGKRGYFYTHGMTADKKAARVRELLPNAEIISAEDFWNAWPRDSYWLVTFRLQGV